jgi:hydrogenase maturation protease
VLCVGNPFRRDDGVAAAVADLARRTLPATVRILDSDGEPARLAEAWRGADLAIIVDASRSDLPAGTVRRIEVGLHGHLGPGSAVGLPAAQGTSTHGWSIGDAVELGQALRRLPQRLVVFSVEGEDFGAGVGLSAPVEGAVDDVVHRIAREVSDTAEMSGPAAIDETTAIGGMSVADARSARPSATAEVG